MEEKNREAELWFPTIFSAALSLALLLFATGTVEAQAGSLLYSFKGQDDGGVPYAGLIMDSSGNLYGTTFKGGTSHHGTVFELADVNGDRLP
jgi:hypothetical protein